MSIPVMPSTHTWVQLGPGFSKTGNAQGGGVALFVGDDADVWVWDEDTNARVTDLLDASGNPVTSVPVHQGWLGDGNPPGVGVPVAVAVPSFSVGQFGKRMASLPVQTLRNASAALAPTDTQVATLVNDTGSSTRAGLNSTFGTKAQQDANTTNIAGKVGKGELVVSVWDYGVVGDGTATDTTAVQSAVTAAGTGGTVLFPRGTFGQSRFKVGALTVPDFQTWDSGGNSRVGGAAAQTHLDFTGLASGAAITTGASVTLRNLRIAGPGSSTATIGVTAGSGSTQTLDGVSVVDFGTGVDWASIFYGQLLNRVNLARNGTALKLTNCYNVTLLAPHIHCLGTDGVTEGTGVEISGTCRSLNIVGGSIEQYATAVKGASNSGHNLHGVYFETAAGNAKGVDCSGKTGFSVNTHDCTVYLSETMAWVDVTTATSFVLNGGGNKFICTASTTPAAPVAYSHSATPSGDITLGGDSWADVTLAGVLYVPAVNGVYPRVTVAPPGSIDPTYIKSGRSVVRPLKVVTTTYQITTADETILCSAAATFQVTLPTRTGLPFGRTFEVKNQASSAASITVARTDGFLENSTSAITLAPGASGRFIQDGANWHRL